MADQDYEDGTIRKLPDEVRKRADECSGVLQLLVTDEVREEATPIYMDGFTYGYFEAQRKETMYPHYEGSEGAVYVFYDVETESFGYRIYVRGPYFEEGYSEEDVTGFRSCEQAEKMGMLGYMERFPSAHI